MKPLYITRLRNAVHISRGKPRCYTIWLLPQVHNALYTMCYAGFKRATGIVLKERQTKILKVSTKGRAETVRVK